MHSFLKWMMVLSAALVAVPAAAQITPTEANGLNLGSDGWNSGPVAGYVLFGQHLTAKLSGGNNGGISNGDVSNYASTLAAAQTFTIINNMTAITGAPHTNRAMTLSGGVRPSHMLFNLTDTAGNVPQTSGGELINTDGNVQLVSGSSPPIAAGFKARSAPLRLTPPPSLVGSHCWQVDWWCCAVVARNICRRKRHSRQTNLRPSQPAGHILGDKLDGQF